MPQKIFKIYNERTNFWQWDTKQKLIVLDDRVTEVRFSNKNMQQSKRRVVYTDNGMRVCNVPDSLLQLPKTLIAYACVKLDDGSCSTIKEVRFAVVKQAIPVDYVCEQDAVVDNIMTRLELLEALIKDVEQGNQEMKRFDNIVDASSWVKENARPGVIVVVNIDGKWVPHIVEGDLSLSPICGCDGEMLTIQLELKTYIDEQIKLVEIENVDDGEI